MGISPDERWRNMVIVGARVAAAGVAASLESSWAQRWAAAAATLPNVGCGLEMTGACLKRGAASIALSEAFVRASVDRHTSLHIGVALASSNSPTSGRQTLYARHRSLASAGTLRIIAFCVPSCASQATLHHTLQALRALPSAAGSCSNP